MSNESCCWNCGAPPTRPAPLPTIPPELSVLLRTNEVVDSIHAPYIDEFISTGRSNLRSLRSRLKYIETSVAPLNYEHRCLEQTLHLHECARSPIRRIPSEIISYIIRLSPDIRHTTGYSEREHAPWRLAHVCARWRACALADRKIWATFQIYTYTFPYKFDKVFPLPMIQAQLSNSRDAPLDILLDWSQLRVESRLETSFLAILNALLEHSTRWCRVVLKGPSNAAVCAALSRVNIRLPQLRRLAWSLLPPASLTQFEFFPSLQEVCLTPDKSGLRERELPLSSLSSIPWPQITKYQGTFPRGVHLDILRRMPALRECSLLLSGRLPSETALTTASLEIPHLRRLRVEDSSLLDHLVAPALQDFFLTRCTPSVLPFLNCSGAHLTSLTIFDWLPNPDLIHVLRAMPGLTHLCVGTAHTKEGRDDLVTLVTMLGDDAADLCPNVRSMMWRDGFDFKFYQDLFLSMVESRWRARRLTCLRLLLPACRIEADTAKRLETLGDAGLDSLVLCAWLFWKILDSP
ncbi:hypothetical protein C8R45DRAFT_1036470 [Mycena sanguinolenta]|nr:hypothetical protein C8R45DRAFT_1036470 [Mycena sanguinolenta]